MNCELSVVTSQDGYLFPDDGFSPTIPITEKQCWVGFQVDANVESTLSAAIDGFGIAFHGASMLGLSTYSLFEAPPTLPTLKDAVEIALGNFSVTHTVRSVREQRLNTVNVSELSGTVSLTGSYGIPMSVGAFATATLPYNFNIAVSPAATAEVQGALDVTGEFLIRSHKISDKLVRLGIYKKKGTTLSASISASAGIEVLAGNTDLLGMVLNAALPGADANKCGIPADTAKALNSVIKETIDRSIAIELNAACSASSTHEAALLYEISLDEGDTARTDSALKAALAGDWTLLPLLPNARSLRNVLVETRERKQVLSLNLLGLYNAASASDYVKKCTILHDELGHLTIIDKEEASRISESTAPYSSNLDKLRHALAQDFLTTATYGAAGASFSIVQSYFDYAENMSPQQLRANVRLGDILGVVRSSALDSALERNLPLSHAKIDLILRYENAAVMSIFFSDPVRLISRTREQLERVGREVLAALLDPSDAVDAARIRVLNDDTAWSAMDSNGNPSNFGTISSLRGLGANALADVGVDWTGIRWWADTVSKVAPAIVSSLAALEKRSANDPSSDPDFMKRRAKLGEILEAAARDTKSSFVNAWGPAVIFALTGKHGVIQMNIAWDGNSQHVEISS